MDGRCRDERGLPFSYFPLNDTNVLRAAPCGARVRRIKTGSRINISHITHRDIQAFKGARGEERSRRRLASGLARGKFRAILRCVINVRCKSCAGDTHGVSLETPRRRVKVEKDQEAERRRKIIDNAINPPSCASERDDYRFILFFSQFHKFPHILCASLSFSLSFSVPDENRTPLINPVAVICSLHRSSRSMRPMKDDPRTKNVLWPNERSTL